MKKVSLLVISALSVQLLVSGIPAEAATAQLRIVSASSNGSVANVTWTPPNLGKREFFEIELSKLSSNGKSSTLVKKIKIKQNLIARRLEAFTSYKIRVRKTLTPSKWTAYRQFRTTSDPVTNLQSVNIGYTTADLTWDSVEGATGYEVNYAGLTKMTLTNKISLSGLKPATTYDVKIRATGKGKKGIESEYLNLQTIGSGPDKVLATNITKTSFVLNWSSILGADSYNIYRDGVLIGSTKLLNFEVTSLTPGSKSRYSVDGIFGSSPTLKSGEIEVSTLMDTPKAPVLTSVTSQDVTVSWTLDPNAVTYAISVYDSLGTSVIKSNKVAGSLSSTTITGLLSQTSYTVGIVVNYSDVSSKESPLITFATSKPSIAGITSTNITTTSVTLAWSSLNSAISYEVYRDGVLISNAIPASTLSYTFVNLSPGQTHRLGVRAAFIDGGKGTSFTEISVIAVTTTPDAAYKPNPTVSPVIILPNANVLILLGATIKVDTGTWNSIPAVSSYSYQWQRSVDYGNTWNDIAGATSTSYVVTVSDNTFQLRARVKATNINGTGVAYTSNSGPVSSVYNVQVPIVRGIAVVGQLLEVSDGTWESPYPFTLSYKWITSRTGGYIAGADSPTYSVPESEVGFTISAQVLASTTYGYLSVNSPPRGPVTIVGNTVLPAITGTLKVGGTLTVSEGVWLNSETGSVITYQWQSSADGVLWDSILGATSRDYVLTLAQSGLYIRAQVFNTKSGSTVIVNSPRTERVPVLNLVNTVAPVVTGAWSVGTTLTTSTGTWSTNGTYSYKWQSSSDNNSWSDITSATSSSYLLTLSESSKYVRVQVTNTTSSGSGVAYSSSRSKVGSPYNTVIPLISGSLRVGSVQTASTGTWLNTPTGYTYQWQKSADGLSWIAIDGAILATYTPTFDVANLKIRVVVNASNLIGTSDVSSLAIRNFLPPVATTVPVITGTPTVGQSLTSSTGTWPSTDSGYAFQWQKSSDGGVTWVNILGASTSTYSLVPADAGYLIRSQVSLTTNAGTSTAYSLATSPIAV